MLPLSSSELLPLLAVLAFVGLFFGLARPDVAWARFTATAVVVAVAAWYLSWRIGGTLPESQGLLASLWAYFFLAMEMVVIVSSVMTAITLSRRLDRERSAEVERNLAWVDETCPLVDLVVPTYNEPAEILERTIIGATNQSYPNLRVWILDDGDREWLKEMCESYGAGYLTREGNAHAKAGNMNAGLAAIRRMGLPEAEFLAVLDADFVATPEFVRRSLALMRDPGVGIVQTPQNFFNADPLQMNLAIGRAWPDEQRFFFEILMPARDAWGTPFCCGTSSITRMKYLNAVGGIPTDSVTEDMLLSLRMAQHGWRTVYLNEPLTFGLAPESLAAYRIQRGRWCAGFMQCFAGEMNPFRIGNRLSFMHRFAMLESFLYWGLSFPARFALIAAPAVYWLTGVFVMDATAAGIAVHVLPFLILSMAYSTWISRGRMLPLITEVGQLAFTPEAIGGTVSGLRKKKKLGFKVTPKGAGDDGIVIHRDLLAIFGVCGALTVIAMGYAFLGEAWWLETGPMKTIGFLWCVYNTALLLLACVVCFERPRLRSEERFAAAEDVVLLLNGREVHGRASDFSLSGAFVETSENVEAGAEMLLLVPRTGPLKVRVRRRTPNGVGLEFVDPREAKTAMLLKLYTEKNMTNLISGEISGVDVLGHLVRRLVA